MADTSETWSERFEREVSSIGSLLRRRPLLAIVFLAAMGLYGWHQFIRTKDSDISIHRPDQPIPDKLLGIEWAAKPSAKMLSFNAALGYCRGLVSADMKDWRLPSVRELSSIVDQELLDPRPLTDVTPLYGPFAKNSAGYLFSGTMVPDHEGDPWIMNLRNGHIFNGNGYEAFAWCVRDSRFSAANK